MGEKRISQYTETSYKQTRTHVHTHKRVPILFYSTQMKHIEWQRDVRVARLGLGKLSRAHEEAEQLGFDSGYDAQRYRGEKGSDIFV